ncbi:leucine zipper protein 1 [Rhinatrema bivittatum]|uniref:leucine zipper protein 1 n=1 Tax=Rhinatrema bivittatum TaxID=194408 RepID=UPI00112CA74B|nr:leucine zipper protein 1 [Rhinatrema bivittatum]XP_029475341.1 leucine zipper protein 1 [Rhinatrema bivittatum]XP_029475342.1 leucine zipper protein 1 [Rhinatrema bivittatum]
MAEVASSRHLRFKLQSLSRRLDELEEATRNLQKAEDEVLDLQDKIIQAEGSNSSMLADVEALRKRVLKIEGKDEEIRKAEELSRQMKEKLEEEESMGKQLRADVEQLQKQMADLEKLEEAFSRSKSDCMQLCLSLNEEKNLSKKLATELELLRGKVKELELSEGRLDKSEQQLASELEKLKSLTLSFASERKGLLEKEKQSEKLIEELTQKLEQINKRNAEDQTRKAENRLERSPDTFVERNDLRIEDDFIPREGRRKRSLDYLKLSDDETNKTENEKNKNQEDNKIKDLNQEIEKLKIQLKHFEAVEEELEKMQTKNNDLQEKYLSEQNKARLLSDQVQELMGHVKKQKEMENGEAEREEILSHERLRNDRAKNRGTAAEAPTGKQKSRELSPQAGRDRPRHRDISLTSDSNSPGSRQMQSSSVTSRMATKTSSHPDTANDTKKPASSAHLSLTKEAVSMPHETKKSREQPSVLSRYPPAAQEQSTQKSWKASPRLGNKVERTAKTYGDTLSSNAEALNGDRGGVVTAVKTTEKEAKTSLSENLDPSVEVTSLGSDSGLPDGSNLSSVSPPPSLGSESSGSSATLVGPLGSSWRDSSEAKPSRAARNSEDWEPSDTALWRTNFPSYSKTQERAPPTPCTLTTEESKGSEKDDPSINPQSESGLNSQATRRGGMKPKIATKPGASEKLNTEGAPSEGLGKAVNLTEEKGNGFAQSELESRRPSNPRAGVRARGPGRTANFQSEKAENGSEEESERPQKAGSDAVEKEDASVQVAGKTKRPFSPREALQSKVVIKPAIIEKDIKELMGGVGSEVKLFSKTTSNKMSSSITIYPSEGVTARSSSSESSRETEVSENSHAVTTRTGISDSPRGRKNPSNTDLVTARTTVGESATGSGPSENSDPVSARASNAESAVERETSENSDAASARASESESPRGRRTPKHSDLVTARASVGRSARGSETSENSDTVTTRTAGSAREREATDILDPVFAKNRNVGNARERETTKISDRVSARTSNAGSTKERETSESSDSVTTRPSISESPKGRRTPMYIDLVTARSSAGESARERGTSENSDMGSTRTRRTSSYTDLVTGENARGRRTSENSDSVTGRTSNGSARGEDITTSPDLLTVRTSTGDSSRKRETSEILDTVTTRTRGRKTPSYLETIITSGSSTGESLRGRKASENSDFATARTSISESPRGRKTSVYSDFVTARTSVADGARERDTSGNSDTVSARTSVNESPRGRKAPIYSETIITARTSVAESPVERETFENSDTATARTSTGERTRERHTSTSNIRITPNEIPAVTNSINTPFEISINKSEVGLTVSELERPADKADVLISRSSITIKPLDPAERKNSNQALSENISWKSHSVETDPAETRSTTAKSSWRTRRHLNSVDELDDKVDRSQDSADTVSTRWRSPSLLDIEAKASKVREPYSRRTSAIIHSWNTPELVSRRSKSSLSPSEIVTRRSYHYDPLLSSSLVPWDRTQLLGSSDLLTSSRRRRDRERVPRTELAGKRSSKAVLQSDSYLKGSKVEERVRQLNHYSEEK